MISEVLLPALSDHFPNNGFIEGEPSDDLVVTFKAKHPSVGDVLIYDHGHEVTVVIGDITHSHFNPYDETLSDEERIRFITEDVVEFLEELFADQVLLFKNLSGRGGGWERLNYSDTKPKYIEGELYYYWSGPYVPKAT